MCQMLAPLQQYADKVLPYANAVLWLLYLRALCSDTLGLCSIIALSSLAPKHHLAPRLVPNLAPDLAPGLAPNLSFGAIFFLAPGFGAETYHFWRHIVFWRRILISGASFWRRGSSGGGPLG